MNEKDIKSRIKPYFIPEPHSSVLNAALSELFKPDGEGCVKVEKTKQPDGSYKLKIEVFKP